MYRFNPTNRVLPFLNDWRFQVPSACEEHWMSNVKPFGHNSMDESAIKAEQVAKEIFGVDDERPDNPFAKRFSELQGIKAITIGELVDEINARGNITVNASQIQYLRKTGPSSLKAARGTLPLLRECAAIFGCDVKDFFTTEPPSKPDSEREELIRMAQVGLDGPKSQFLIDAIELAYGSAIVSRPRR